MPRNLIQTVKIFAACHLFAEYLLSVKGTYGPSMLPTIEVRDDWVFISKLHRRGRGIEVGDVVSIMHPMIPEVGAIKRVLGMPGDFVLRDTPGQGKGMMIQVPHGHCWVIGDNLESSRDSRMYGPQPLALIKGKVLAKFHVEWGWPWQWRVRANRLTNSMLCAPEES
ncbi:MAG: hypothetical protein M1832_004288 [Thelocarpon impressellum]|nr:MAG: hypothetical protein M1832_004288 [Thelocarpon impressellum]